MKRRNRVYVDTSVFGGVFDDAFSDISRRFFVEVGEGRRIVLLSEITLGELRDAPEHVREFAASLSPEAIEEVEFTYEMAELRDAYVAVNLSLAYPLINIFSPREVISDEEDL